MTSALVFIKPSNAIVVGLSEFLPPPTLGIPAYPQLFNSSLFTILTVYQHGNHRTPFENEDS